MKIEYIVDRAVVTHGPDMRAAFGFNELDDNPDAVSSLLHATFQ